MSGCVVVGLEAKQGDIDKSGVESCMVRMRKYESCTT